MAKRSTNKRGYSQLRKWLAKLQIRARLARPLRDSNIRLSLCLRDGTVEIFSCETNTAVLLPEQDIDLLIANLKSFHQDRSIRETVSLDPFS
jgi:hypothetical protein